MRPRTLLAISLAVTVSAAVRAEGPADDELDVPFDAILLRGADVFATHGGGIFRAELEAKKWERLKLPAEMPTGGRFGGVPQNSPLILYYATKQSTDTAKKSGLYLSDDAGQTWRLITEKDDLGPVTLLEDGGLFAVTNAGRANGPAVVEMSRDLGKSWRDITGKAFGEVYSLFADPDHPGLICLDVSSFRGYILQADDERYEWKATRSWDWRPEKREAVPFGRSYSTSATNNPLYELQATLRNYFDFDFGKFHSIPAIDLSPDKTRFTFRAGEEVNIPVTVRFLEDLRIRAWYARQHPNARGSDRLTPIVEKLLDHPSDLGLWGLRVEFQGKRAYRAPGISAAVRRIRKGLPGRRDEETRALMEKIKGDPAWKASELSAATPYRRTINLSKLYDFTQPGDYRVQLDYDNINLGDRAQGHWVGEFSSRPFAITIHPHD